MRKDILEHYVNRVILTVLCGTRLMGNYQILSAHHAHRFPELFYQYLFLFQ